MRDASYEIPKYYECLEFSTCGCVAAGYSDTEKKIIVINNESGRQREIDVRENLYPNKKYQNVLRIEKTLVYACLFICPDFEFHVEVDMRSKKWKIHKQFTDQFTDKTISDNGQVIVEQWDNSDGGLDYSFERDKSLITILTAPHLRTVSNEPMMMLSHPAGKYCYIKSLGTLFEIEPQKQLKMPFKKPYMQIEWIDDAHNVVCVDAGAVRELWCFKDNNKWCLYKRMRCTQYPGLLPLKNVYSTVGQTIMLNAHYYTMVPPVSHIYFGREQWAVFANDLLRFNDLR